MSAIADAPLWFLQLSLLILAGYFLWSIKNVLSDFKDEVKGLRDLVGKLFDQDKSIEARLSTLEGRCEATHHGAGRRGYDHGERL